MKRVLFVLTAFLVFVLPALPQGNDESEEVPVSMLTMKKGNIPPAVIKAAENIFKGSTQTKFGVFPNEFKNYGWEANKNYNEPIDHYEVILKTSNGAEADAVFESTGELIRYKLTDKNAALPEPVLKAIGKTEYKDWKMTGDTEIIKSSQKKVVDHYVVRFEKDSKKKTVYYTMSGDVVSNK